MGRKTIRFALLLLATCLPGCGGGTGIKVLVLDDLGQPLDGADVKLEQERPPAEGPKFVSGKTATDGRCSVFAYHDTSKYTPFRLKITKPGFAPYQELIDESPRVPREIFLTPLLPRAADDVKIDAR